MFGRHSIKTLGMYQEFGEGYNESLWRHRIETLGMYQSFGGLR